MSGRYIPWKSEWKAAGLDPGPLTTEEEALVPQLQEENSRFLRDHPRTQRRKSVLPWAGWTLPLAAAAVFLIVPWSHWGGVSDNDTRVKGLTKPQLHVYRDENGVPQSLEANSSVSAGDLLQVAYSVERVEQGAILSIDGNGTVTVHLAKGQHSTALAPGGEHALPTSYQLDDAPSYEVFVFVFSSHSFDLAPVIQSMKSVPIARWSDDQFGPGIGFVELSLRKVPHP